MALRGVASLNLCLPLPPRGPATVASLLSRNVDLSKPLTHNILKIYYPMANIQAKFEKNFNNNYGMTALQRDSHDNGVRTDGRRDRYAVPTVSKGRFHM